MNPIIIAKLKTCAIAAIPTYTSGVKLNFYCPGNAKFDTKTQCIDNKKDKKDTANEVFPGAIIDNINAMLTRIMIIEVTPKTFLSVVLFRNTNTNPIIDNRYRLINNTNMVIRTAVAPLISLLYYKYDISRNQSTSVKMNSAEITYIRY